MQSEPPQTKGESQDRLIILVVNDVEETRDGLEQLLSPSGYDVHPARSESEALQKASVDPPDLILISLSGCRREWIDAGTRIRQEAHLDESTPIVLFCIEDLPEGAEVKIDKNMYLIRPDNFDQLRAFIKRLLRQNLPLP